MIQDGEIEQQNFGSGFAESNESIISFESPSLIETQKSVILSNVSNVEETFEEKMDSSQVILGGCLKCFLNPCQCTNTPLYLRFIYYLIHGSS